MPHFLFVRTLNMCSLRNQTLYLLLRRLVGYPHLEVIDFLPRSKGGAELIRDMHRWNDSITFFFYLALLINVNPGLGFASQHTQYLARPFVC
jgi:hypothetical protein